MSPLGPSRRSQVPPFEVMEVLARVAAIRAEGREVRGVANHGFIDSIYFRDPNGYVIELTAKKAGHDAAMNAERQAHTILKSWQAGKRSPAAAAS